MGSALEDWLAARRDARDQAGLTRALHPRGPGDGLLDLAGNDYLGLATDPRVTAAAAEAARTWGAGAGASRLVTGTLDLHVDLESDLAGLLGRRAALVTSTGYHANLAAVTALADAETLIVSDAHVHASLVDACRLARGQVEVVGHRDVADTDRLLAARTQPRALVLTESVFSVLGDAGPVDDLLTVCRRHDATLLVDEAHALGVTGLGGAGMTCELRPDVESRLVVTATLSKSLGSQGGVVLASTDVREHLVNAARPFVFDTGLAPAAAAAAREAVAIIRAEPERVERVRAVAMQLADAVGALRPDGAVLSVPMPTAQDAVEAQREAAEHGIRVGCFRPPSVPDGVSRLRITARATVTDEEVDRAATVLGRLVSR